jgi:hypothetical protein
VPSQSTCDPYGYATTRGLDGTSHQLSWDGCEVKAQFFQPRQGERVLSDDEFDSVLEVLSQVRVDSSALLCAPDNGFVTLDVTKEMGTEAYIAGYACPLESHPGYQVAAGLDELGTRLNELIPE